MRIMASLIRSAAVPCSGVLTAVRSAKPRRFQFLLCMSGMRTDPAEERRNFQFGARLLQRAIDERAHPRVFLEVRVDEALGLFLVDADLLRQPEGRQPIHDAEVHRLGAAAMFGVNFSRPARQRLAKP